MEKIRIGIVGYGNIGKGVEKAIMQNGDTELAAIFTRRAPEQIKPLTPNIPVYSVSEAPNFKDKIDVMILCGGSATDLPKQLPEFAGKFNTVDSFDTHAKIPEYLGVADKIAKENGKISLISIGWDPGLFSLMRVIGSSVLPNSKNYTFWGKGVSQGHSDAIRRIKGVKNAIQYTIPVDAALEAVRSGSNPELSVRQRHTRLCFVVPEDGADLEQIKNDIVTMPNYFADYDTEVNFVTEEELAKNHSKMPHGGFVMLSGNTGSENKQLIEFSLKLDSNPEFTGSVLVAYARAVYRMNKRGISGGLSVLDIAPADLSPLSREQLAASML